MLLHKVILSTAKATLSELPLFKRFAANRLAKTSKRLDICAVQIAHLLHLAGYANTKPLEAKSCLEIGSGWVLTHALVMHLLGAKKVIATDIQALAYPEYLKAAIKTSQISLIRDILAPFGDHEKIRQRLEKLQTTKRFSFDVLKELGIEYVAPVNLADRPMKARFDFVFSASVLEHVSQSDVPSLLRNLTDTLNPNGFMLHAVHLEDHKDFANNSFAFLGEPQSQYDKEMQNLRGNRIRASHWKTLLAHTKGLSSRFLYAWKRENQPIPEKIDRSIKYTDTNDLITSHIGIYGQKNSYFIAITVLAIIGLAALGTGIYLYFNNRPDSADTEAEEQVADSGADSGSDSDSGGDSEEDGAPEEPEYYGSSTLGECSCGCKCRTDGCNGEICRSVYDEAVNTFCSLPDKPLPPDLGYSCTCVNSQCQWTK